MLLLGLDLDVSLRTKQKYLALALTLKLKSLALALDLAQSLALKFQGQGLFQGLIKCKSLEKIDVTIKAQVRFLCPITFKFCHLCPALHHVLLVAYTYSVGPTPYQIALFRMAHSNEYCRLGHCSLSDYTVLKLHEFTSFCYVSPGYQSFQVTDKLL